MCGISAAFIKTEDHKYWDLLANSEIRGQDGTGYLLHKHESKGGHCIVQKTNKKASDWKDGYYHLDPGDVIIGQNRLAIFGLDSSNQQPIVTTNTALVHNGNLLDFDKVFEEEKLERRFRVDSELILRLYEKYKDVEEVKKRIKGDYACILMNRTAYHKKVVIFNKYKPIYFHEDDTGLYYYSSARIGLKTFGVEGTKLPDHSTIIQKYV